MQVPSQAILVTLWVPSLCWIEVYNYAQVADLPRDHCHSEIRARYKATRVASDSESTMTQSDTFCNAWSQNQDGSFSSKQISQDKQIFVDHFFVQPQFYHKVPIGSYHIFLGPTIHCSTHGKLVFWGPVAWDSRGAPKGIPGIQTGPKPPI